MMQETKTANEKRVAGWLLGLLLIAATIAAYQLVWRAGYIWDDDVYVTANPLLTAPDGFRRIWLSLDSPSQYFPLVYSLFRLEHALWGFHPAGYHWVNILLHATNAVLLWRLLRLLRLPGAWLAAALFAVHPVQVESVAWITELKNVLMGFFFLLTLWCWARFFKKDTRARSAYYVAALLFYALALFSKTTACTLPAALLLMLWLKRKPITLARWAQVAPFIIMGGAMGALTIWWERFHQGTQGQAFAVPIPERILIASRALWFYLAKLVWPDALSFSYPRWHVSPGNPADYLWIGLTIVAVLAVWLLRRYTGRSAETALLFFAATLSPVLGFIMLYTFRYTWVADHYQYLACIGPLALFAAGVELASARLGRVGPAVLAVVAAGLILSLGVRTWRQGAIYADAETLWRATIASNPESGLAHNSLGVLIAGKGPVEDEEAEFRKAIEIDPNDAEAHNNLGQVLTRRGLGEEAVAEYDKALSLYPDFPKARGNLATLLLQLGRNGEALGHLQAVLALDPQNAALQDSLGNLLATMQKPDEALEHWKRALELEPKNATRQAAVGRALATAGQLAESLPYLRAAAELAPADAEAHFNYGAALSLLGRFSEAIPEFREAVRLQPGLTAAHLQLANAYTQGDRFQEAATQLEQLLQLQPNNVVAHRALAILLRDLGRTDEADAHQRHAAELEGNPQPAP
ncbi:MAG: tetratricopeptide repeat protein [Chthoniobacterales bacterium]